LVNSNDKINGHIIAYQARVRYDKSCSSRQWDKKV